MEYIKNYDNWRLVLEQTESEKSKYGFINSEDSF